MRSPDLWTGRLEHALEGEHHFQPECYAIIPNQLMMAVHLCHLTKNLKIGCGLKIAPMWYTLWLAEDYAQSRDSWLALSMTSAGRMLRHEIRDFDYVCQHQRFLDDCFHRTRSDRREPQILGHLRDRVRHHGDFVRGSGDHGRWAPLDRRGTWRGTLGAGSLEDDCLVWTLLCSPL
jgi:hypothetical protein